jgi:hypothetical protein
MIYLDTDVLIHFLVPQDISKYRVATIVSIPPSPNDIVMSCILLINPISGELHNFRN